MQSKRLPTNSIGSLLPKFCLCMQLCGFPQDIKTGKQIKIWICLLWVPLVSIYLLGSFPYDPKRIYIHVHICSARKATSNVSILQVHIKPSRNQIFSEKLTGHCQEDSCYISSGCNPDSTCTLFLLLF